MRRETGKGWAPQGLGTDSKGMTDLATAFISPPGVTWGSWEIICSVREVPDLIMPTMKMRFGALVWAGGTLLAPFQQLMSLVT